MKEDKQAVEELIMAQQRKMDLEEAFRIVAEELEKGVAKGESATVFTGRSKHPKMDRYEFDQIQEVPDGMVAYSLYRLNDGVIIETLIEEGEKD